MKLNNTQNLNMRKLMHVVNGDRLVETPIGLLYSII